MINISLLFISVMTLFLYMVPGFVLKKTGLAGEGFAKALSVYVLYIAQGAMFIHGFIVRFDPAVFEGIVKVFILAFVAHLLFYLIARGLFTKAPEKLRRVLRFAVIFSNAGYMGIPVINDVFGDEFTIYASIYVVWFNIFAFSLGRLIYTDDKKYISAKKMLINPAVLPILFGMLLYLTGAGGWIQSVLGKDGFVPSLITMLYNVITVLKGTVAPLSMAVIGAKLADVKLGAAFKDRYLYRFLAVRLIAFPVMMWGIMRILVAFGILNGDLTAVVLILCSTPAAALTTMFAELHDCDAAYSGKLVAVSTLVSIATMPAVALLLKI